LLAGGFAEREKGKVGLFYNLRKEAIGFNLDFA